MTTNVQQPTWNGRAHKGAMRERRAQKRAEAEGRNKAGSWRHSCGHKHSFEKSAQCAISLSLCACGRKAWLMPDASDEECQAFWNEDTDHRQLCEDAL